MANIFSGIDKWNDSSYLENTYKKKIKPRLGRSCETTTEPQSQKTIY